MDNEDDMQVDDGGNVKQAAESDGNDEGDKPAPTGENGEEAASPEPRSTSPAGPDDLRSKTLDERKKTRRTWQQSSGLHQRV